jgi:hypothetical protein
MLPEYSSSAAETNLSRLDGLDFARARGITPVGLARDLILGNGADRRIARPLVSKCSIGGNFRAHAMEGVWFFGHSFDTIGSKSAILASTHALGYTPLSLRREQYGLVTASYSIELEGSQKSLLSSVLSPFSACHLDIVGPPQHPAT